MSKIKQLFEKYREIILYIFFGGCTTVVNYVVYFVLIQFLSVDYLISNIVAWIFAVLFAYVTNRGMVFHSETSGVKSRLKELAAFFGSRLFSLAVETVLLFVFVKWLFMNEFIAKIILAVVVVVLNYIASKLFVFRKKKDNDKK